MWDEILILFYFSRAISYKTEQTERVSLEFVVRDGICQILPLNFQRHSACSIALLTAYTLVTCISERQSSHSLRWRCLKYADCNHGDTCATDGTLFFCRLRSGINKSLSSTAEEVFYILQFVINVLCSGSVLTDSTEYTYENVLAGARNSCKVLVG